jgi:Flp pilus assembly protein TadD
VLIRAGHGAQAVPLVEPLVEQDPTNPRVVLLLGLAHNDAGNPQARPMLERFLRLAPDDPMAPQVRALLEGS